MVCCCRIALLLVQCGLAARGVTSLVNQRSSCECCKLILLKSEATVVLRSCEGNAYQVLCYQTPEQISSQVSQISNVWSCYWCCSGIAQYQCCSLPCRRLTDIAHSKTWDYGSVGSCYIRCFLSFKCIGSGAQLPLNALLRLRL